MDRLEAIRAEIINDPDNAWAGELGYQPLYVAAAAARIAVIGQAPGRVAQDSGIPWNDASGRKLFDWLGVTEEQFRDPARFAILPMDFYYPGKAKTGDLPPRKGFAARWHPQLLAELPEIRLTILIGGYAQQHYLRRQRVTITDRDRPRLPRPPAHRGADRAPLAAQLPLAGEESVVRGRPGAGATRGPVALR